MDYDEKNTKLALVLAAGELFAEHGLEGVSTRMIAKKANANLGSIHYHFGSKEKLYVEAFKYVHEREKQINIVDVIKDNPELTKTREGKAKIIQMATSEVFSNYFSIDGPEWRMKLLVRELVNPSSAFPILVEEIFRPDHQSWVDFFKQVNPGASEDEAEVWGHFLSAQITFYIMARLPIEQVKKKTLDQEFFGVVSRMTAKAMILLLDLPLPDDLKD